MGLAVRGARNLDDGTEQLSNTEDVEYFRRRAQRIYLKTFLSTLVVMIVGRAWLHWFR